MFLAPLPLLRAALQVFAGELVFPVGLRWGDLRLLSSRRSARAPAVGQPRPAPRAVERRVVVRVTADRWVREGSPRATAAGPGPRVFRHQEMLFSLMATHKEIVPDDAQGIAGDGRVTALSASGEKSARASLTHDRGVECVVEVRAAEKEQAPQVEAGRVRGGSGGCTSTVAGVNGTPVSSASRDVATLRAARDDPWWLTSAYLPVAAPERRRGGGSAAQEAVRLRRRRSGSGATGTPPPGGTARRA